MSRSVGVGRWIAILAFLVMGACCPLVASAGFLTTADNVTIQAGGSGQVFVRWTSTKSLNYLMVGIVGGWHRPVPKGCVPTSPRDTEKGR